MIYQIFLYFLAFLFINVNTNNKSKSNYSKSFTKNDIWDPDSLYNYTKTNFLDINNPNRLSNLKHNRNKNRRKTRGMIIVGDLEDNKEEEENDSRPRKLSK